MARPQSRFQCSACGATTVQWQGQCPACDAWNSLEAVPAIGKTPARSGLAPAAAAEWLSVVQPQSEDRISTGLGELDRVLGGGLVTGSVTLLGGDPGIGKSTLLLQATASLAAHHAVLYATGEESLQQVGMRARRLGLVEARARLLAEVVIERILQESQAQRAAVLVIDSIQTMCTEESASAPGAVAQLRDCAAALVRFAKTSGTAVVLIGHVTKEGVIAGPRVLEHMVDTVLYFESDSGSRYRIVRAVKNRFGAANEIGVFAMGETGLKEVRNPSALFLSRQIDSISGANSGSLVTVAREGSRPLLVEVQVLVDNSAASHPRRVAVGLDSNRLSLLLAVLHRHAGIATQGYDVFANVVGGVRIGETAADLAAVLAAVSSLKDQPLPQEVVAFGELGLTGEIRPVPYGEERVREAAKQGFRIAVVPAANQPKHKIEGMEVVPVRRLKEAIQRWF